MPHDTGYSERVVRHFVKPTYAGDAGEPCVAVARGFVRIRLSADVNDGRINVMRFRALGCPHLIAAADWLCAETEGGGIDALQALDVRRIMDELEIPVEKTGLVLLLEDTAQLLYRELAGQCRNES